MKRDFFPLFPSQDPPTALRSASENRLMIKRYMQGECTVIKLTCVDKSERSIGFVHTIPGIMISALEHYKRTMLSMRPPPLWSGGGCSVIFCRRLFQHQKCKLFGMSERPSKGRKVPKNAIFRGGVKILISTS